MKIYHSLFTIAILCALLNGCIIETGGRITPSKNYITRNYKVTDFSRINITTVGDVYYTQSTDGKTSLEIYGPDNIVDLIDVSIKDNTLYLSMNKKNKFRNTKKMKITITTPELYGINFNGVGNIHINDGLKTTSLSVQQQGVGDIRIESLTCEELTVSSSGVGNTRLAGTAQFATFTAQGVGNIEAEELNAENVTATSQGVGNISCFASKSISAAVQGVGNIQYKGSPEEKRINKSGVGTIKQL